jgi:hypothetical protein
MGIARSFPTNPFIDALVNFGSGFAQQDVRNQEFEARQKARQNAEMQAALQGVFRDIAQGVQAGVLNKQKRDIATEAERVRVEEREQDRQDKINVEAGRREDKGARERRLSDQAFARERGKRADTFFKETGVPLDVAQATANERGEIERGLAMQEQLAGPILKRQMTMARMQADQMLSEAGYEYGWTPEQNADRAALAQAVQQLEKDIQEGKYSPEEAIDAYGQINEKMKIASQKIPLPKPKKPPTLGEQRGTGWEVVTIDASGNAKPGADFSDGNTVLTLAPGRTGINVKELKKPDGPDSTSVSEYISAQKAATANLVSQGIEDPTQSQIDEEAARILNHVRREAGQSPIKLPPTPRGASGPVEDPGTSAAPTGEGGVVTAGVTDKQAQEYIKTPQMQEKIKGMEGILARGEFEMVVNTFEREAKKVKTSSDRAFVLQQANEALLAVLVVTGGNPAALDDGDREALRRLKDWIAEFK